MDKVSTYKEFDIFKLSKKLALKNMDNILTALNLIPMVDRHNENDILLEKSGDRIFHAKWEHGLIALTQKNEFAGILIGYERDKEENLQYPANAIYISGFAINNAYQKKGLGKFLVKTWIEYNSKNGFRQLSGKLRFAVQTNKADWNIHVQRLYESFGFKKIAEKSYGNRIDNVYVLVP